LNESRGCAAMQDCIMNLPDSMSSTSKV
jgi:hypothetical protein